MNDRISQDQLVMGAQCLQTLLSFSPHKIVKVFTEKGRMEKRKEELLSLCQKNKIPVVFVSFDQLTKLAGSDAHQSFVMQMKPRIFLDCKQFLTQSDARAKSVVLMLDQIFDPHNFGAILRSAACFGVEAIVYSKNRGTEITPVVTKTSCGASEVLPLIRVANLAETVTQFQEAGYEAVVSVLNVDAKPLSSFTFSDKTLLIVGSEGEGVQPLIQKRADHGVYIPMQGNIASLNVAQASSVLLYAALQCRGPDKGNTTSSMK